MHMSDNHHEVFRSMIGSAKEGIKQLFSDCLYDQ